jgi:hypothetical protein
MNGFVGFPGALRVLAVNRFFLPTRVAEVRFHREGAKSAKVRDEGMRKTSVSLQPFSEVGTEAKAGAVLEAILTVTCHV